MLSPKNQDNLQSPKTFKSPKKILKRIAPYLLVLQIIAQPAHALVPLPAGGPAEGWTITTILAVASAVVSKIASLGAVFMQGMQNSFNNTMSAIGIATKQEAANTQQVISTIQDSSKNFIAGIRYQQQSSDQLNAWMNYSPQTGQGFNVCKSIAEQQSIEKASKNIELNIAEHINNLDVDNAAGTIADNPEELISKRIEKHRENFCSKEEAAKGLCDENESLANADINPDLLFKNIEKDSPEDKARVTYIENILGVPDAYTAKDNSVSGLAYVLNKAQKDAFLSIPNYSLNYLRLQNTKQNGEDSFNAQVEKKVNQYLVGNTAKEWTKTLASQSERGLMMELLKAQANQTWLKQRQLEDQLRQEATLAALLLLSNKNRADQMTAEFADQKTSKP